MRGTGVLKKTHLENQSFNIILNEVQHMDVSSEGYPKIQGIQSWNELLSPLLKYFIKHLAGPELKQAALGLCLTKTVIPIKFIPSLLLGLGIEVYHLIGSKILLKLVKMGYWISYDDLSASNNQLQFKKIQLPKAKYH